MSQQNQLKELSRELRDGGALARHEESKIEFTVSLSSAPGPQGAGC